MRVVLGRDGGGIGAFDVHPAGGHLAIAERSSTNASPHVFIYALPSLELTHVLCEGTERAYSDVCFSGNGDKLVTVGSFPDFLLSVWDWREQRGVLRTKAFGQEVCLGSSAWVSVSSWRFNLMRASAASLSRRFSMLAIQSTTTVALLPPAQGTCASGAWPPHSRA